MLLTKQQERIRELINTASGRPIICTQATGTSNLIAHIAYCRALKGENTFIFANCVYRERIVKHLQQMVYASYSGECRLITETVKGHESTFLEFRGFPVVAIPQTSEKHDHEGEIASFEWKFIPKVESTLSISINTDVVTSQPIRLARIIKSQGMPREKVLGFKAESEAIFYPDTQLANKRWLSENIPEIEAQLVE